MLQGRRNVAKIAKFAHIHWKIQMLLQDWPQDINTE